jgi:hypothetical protein
MDVKLEQRLRQKKVQRRIYGPKGDKLTGGWRKLHDEMFSVDKWAKCKGYS